MTVWLPCVGASELLRVVSSAPYSQAATGVRRDICRVAGPVRPQPATMTPAALSVSAGCCETDPTGVAIGQLPQGSVMYFSGSLSDSPRRLTELTKEGYLASRTLLETSQRSLGGCRAGFSACSLERPDDSPKSPSCRQANMILGYADPL